MVLATRKLITPRSKQPFLVTSKEDVSFFLAFRFFDKAPMVGYRKEEVFYVLWLDREFKLYQHSG
jgi:hypothetical protein